MNLQKEHEALLQQYPMEDAGLISSRSDCTLPCVPWCSFIHFIFCTTQLLVAVF